jgi:hypothetical protein
MKGAIEPDHISLNKFDLRVLGMIPLIAVSVSGIEDELETVTLPDRTVASGGNRGPVEFEITIPMHHGAAFLAMEAWFREGQDPVSPTYKKPCTMTHSSLSGETRRGFALIGCFVKGRSTPDVEMENEGEMATVVYKMSADDIEPI